MHCYTEVAASKRGDYDASVLAANKLSKAKSGDLDGYGGGKGMGMGRMTDGKDESASQTNANDYTLPDGSKINISNADKARAPEILFKPSLIGLEYPGIHELVSNCIKACDIDLRHGLQSSIVVAGSTTMMKSFCGRLHKSIQNLMPKNNNKVTLMAPANRQYSCWIGGSTISELKAFDRMWISKNQFEEDAGRILSVNCMQR
jgi:centractin